MTLSPSRRCPLLPDQHDRVPDRLVVGAVGPALDDQRAVIADLLEGAEARAEIEMAAPGLQSVAVGDVDVDHVLAVRADAGGDVGLLVFQFMWTWNEFAMPLIYVQRDELRPISLGTMFFFGRFTADRGLIAAGVTIAMIPVIVLYLLLQRRFIEGITAGALKS